MKLQITANIDVYENNGKEFFWGELLKIESHRIRSGLVVLTFDNKQITVAASDLIDAVRRCSR